MVLEKNGGALLMLVIVIGLPYRSCFGIADVIEGHSTIRQATGLLDRLRYDLGNHLCPPSDISNSTIFGLGEMEKWASKVAG